MNSFGKFVILVLCLIFGAKQNCVDACGPVPIIVGAILLSDNCGPGPGK